MVSYDDADRAMTLVREHYSKAYPKLLDVHDSKQIYVFAEPAEFLKVFEITWERTFKAANGYTESAGEVVDFVNGFVASDVHNFHRKIYIKKVEAIKWGTLVHEYIHFLQHRNFYPMFYSIGGKNPDLVEGVTEYLTRRVHVVLLARDNYDPQFLKAKSWVETDSGNYQKMLDYCFQGKACTLW